MILLVVVFYYAHKKPSSMLFSGLPKIHPLMLLIGKNFGSRRRDLVEQAGLQKHLFRSLRSLGIYRTGKMSAFVITSS
jgi:hypothetical protein